MAPESAPSGRTRRPGRDSVESPVQQPRSHRSQVVMSRVTDAKDTAGAATRARRSLCSSPAATLRCPISDERGNGKGERDSPPGTGGINHAPRSGHRLDQSLPDWSPQLVWGPGRAKTNTLPSANRCAIRHERRESSSAGRAGTPVSDKAPCGRKDGEVGPAGAFTGIPVLARLRPIDPRREFAKSHLCG
jgi:hypothetical protein